MANTPHQEFQHLLRSYTNALRSLLHAELELHILVAFKAGIRPGYSEAEYNALHTAREEEAGKWRYEVAGCHSAMLNHLLHFGTHVLEDEVPAPENIPDAEMDSLIAEYRKLAEFFLTATPEEQRQFIRGKREVERQPDGRVKLAATRSGQASVVRLSGGGRYA